jgi:NAD(P)-dependent dehydrogenase (short-subunit alcohol dehydrogenase family)
MLNKYIIVTGATSGLGLSTCKELLDAGARVFGIGRDISKLDALGREYAQDQLIYESFDLSKVNDIELFLQESIDKNGKVDGFVHCAGIEETIPLPLYTPEKIKEIYNINVFASIELLRIISKKKNSNNGASFVFISSVMGNLGQAGKVGYCSTKAALLGVVKSSALELSKRRIRVNAILPGIVDTPLTKKLFENISETSKKQIVDMHPLGLGSVEDVVPSIAFLLSNHSSWITGQSIVVDGGYSIH